MPEHNNNNDTGKLRSYQSIYVYDGNDPSQFKTWHAKVISHYATWLNGETQAGHWKQHLISDGCFVETPSDTLDDNYLTLFKPHLIRTDLDGLVDKNTHACETDKF